MNNRSEYRELAAAALRRLISAASQENKLSKGEADRIGAFAEAFGLPFDSTDVVSNASSEIALLPGLRVCLTGSPKSESEKHLRKPALRELLKEYGMAETDSVTG